MAKSLKAASKKSIHESNVEQLGNLGTDMAEFDTLNLTVIEDVLGSFIERVISNIEGEDMIVTGKIEDITLQAENDVVNVYANPWLIYQDRGVNGSVKALYDTPHRYSQYMPPVDIFIQYIKTKNLQLRDNAKYGGKESEYKKLDEDQKIVNAAWGMAAKIYREGFKPRLVYSKEIDSLIQDITDQLGTIAIQQINQVIDVKDSAKRTIIKP